MVCVALLAAFIYVVPTFKPGIWPHKQINLGLDLQGGMHLVLELDRDEINMSEEEESDAIDRALEIIRTRVDQFGVSEPLIQKAGNERIIVELAGVEIGRAHV